jgi:NADH-quinone oxidoreductase subunit N
MFLNDWLTDLQKQLATVDVPAFAPELALCGGIVLMLLLRLFNVFNRYHMGPLALVVTLLATAVSAMQWSILPSAQSGAPLFGGMLVLDRLTIFLRLVLFGFTALVILLTLLTRIPDRDDSADFYSLLLGAAIGMSLMASANHLLMIFIGVEMASLPSYALAGFLKGKRQSSEAALKYVVYGGGAAGIMLYGISLVAGKFGTGYLPDVALGYAGALKLTVGTGGLAFDPVLLLGTLFILVGIGFKLAAVPFHFWCPDVFEGASAEVAAFLSVASKGAALALLGRFALTVAGLSTGTGDWATWLKMSQYLGLPIGILAAVTATFGNLAAYLQTNLKRLLAYSTIAQAGYMMMGLATLSPDGVSAVLFYLVVYLVMNLGAFAIVAFLRNLTGSEELSSFRGLVQRAPILVIALGFFLFSLVGIPPLGGFAAKFQIFRALFKAGTIYDAHHATTLSYTMYALVLIGGLNTVFSLVYYIKVLKVMILERVVEDVEGGQPAALPVSLGISCYSVVLAVAIFIMGIAWDNLAGMSNRGVDHFRSPNKLVPLAEAPAPQAAAADASRERQVPRAEGGRSARRPQDQAQPAGRGKQQ